MTKPKFKTTNRALSNKKDIRSEMRPICRDGNVAIAADETGKGLPVGER